VNVKLLTAKDAKDAKDTKETECIRVDKGSASSLGNLVDPAHE